MQDEPILGPAGAAPPGTSTDPSAIECIRELVHGEPFAVLCTQGGGQPYGSVVAFAFEANLRAFAFSTPVATRKFRLLSECHRVALVVDNRGRFPEDMTKIGAVTVTGKAIQLEPGPELERWVGLLTARHPYLEFFFRAPSTAVFRVDATRYLHVTRFQEVRQWVPTAG
jgi:hypothetical protein